MNEETFQMMMRQSKIIYFNGKTVKDRYNKAIFPEFNLFDDIENKVKVDFWDEKNQILSLKSNY